MLAEAVNCTHNGTGGSGTLTLTNVTGWPQITSVFGTSGTINVQYVITEYTDSTLVTLSKYESGTGSIVLSTNVLTRTLPRVTWDGTTYDNTTPAALSFGNTAANVRVTLTAGSNASVLQVPKLHNGTSEVTLDSGFHCLDSRQQFDGTVGAGVTMADGTKYWRPLLLGTAVIITTVGLRVVTGQSAKSARVGLYDWNPSNGLAGNLIQELTSSTQIDLTTGNVWAGANLASPTYFPAGWYWVCLQTNSSTATIDAARAYGYGMLGATTARREIIHLSKTGTYGALPSTMDTTLTAVTLSTNNPYIIGFK